MKATVQQQSPDDEIRTAQTIELMRRYVREDSRSPIIRRAAYDAIGSVRRRDPRAEAASVWAWIRRRVSFLSDRKLAEGLKGIAPADSEVLVRPIDLVVMPEPVGDCDDHSMLAAAMLRVLGIPAAFRTIAADPDRPDTYSHVYVIALLSDGEYAIDASHGPRPGWEPPAAGKSRTWRIEPMNGMGNFDWSTAINKGIDITGNILTARYAQPPPGTYRQTPQGIVYRQPPNAPPYQFPGGGFSLTQSDSTTLFLIVGAVVALVLIMRR